MKKAYLFILFLCAAVMLCCCGQNEKENGNMDTTQTQTEETEYPDDGKIHYDFKKVDFPSDVRQVIVDYMREMGSVKWTPEKSFSVKANDFVAVGLELKKGTTYQGLLYTDRSDDLADWEALLKDGVYVGPTDKGFKETVGNVCSSAINEALKRCINISVSASYTYVPSQDASIVPVGGYTYPDSNKDTAKIIKANGKEAMYKALAELKPGDIVVHFQDGKAAGHVRLVSKAPIIEYKPDGSINEKKSKITTIEQTNQLDRTASENLSCWRIDNEYTFAQLITDTYIPVSVKMLNELPKPDLTLEDANTAEDILSGVKGTVDFNYRLTGVTLKVTDKTGNTVKEYHVENTGKTSNISLRKFSLAFGLSDLQAGEYTYTLTAENEWLGGNFELLRIDFKK